MVTSNGDYWCHSKHTCTMINKDGTCGLDGKCIDATKRDREYENIFDKYENEICKEENE